MIRADRLYAAFADSSQVMELAMALVRHRSGQARLSDEAGPQWNLPLGADDVVLAQQLAAVIGPIGGTAAALIDSGRVALIEAASTNLALSAKEMLVQYFDAHYDMAKACADEEEAGSEGERQVPLMAIADDMRSTRMMRELLSKAYRTETFVACFASAEFEEADLGPFLLAADTIVALPTITVNFVAKACQCLFGHVPDEIRQMTGFEQLTGDWIGGVMRPGRSVQEITAVLAQVLNGPARVPAPDKKPRLEDAVGFGSAKEWAMDLASDFALWRGGALEWDEVPERGVLVSGAPGTGKTTFARLLASTLDSPLVETSVAAWNGFDNLSGTIKEMNRVFDKAQALQAVLFIDELDGINRRDRSTDRNRSYWDQVVNHLLTRVNDILECPGVVVVGATNYPDNIDPALLRAGRIERHIRIELPVLDDRVRILDRYLKGALAHDEVERVATLTERFTGADLKSLTRSALARARRAKRELEVADILSELRRDMDALGEQDRRRALIYAAGQEMVSQTLGIPKGRGPEYATLPMLQDRLAALVAGRVAEEMLLGQVSTLGEADLINATQLAEAIEMRFGMGAIGPIVRERDNKDEAQRSAVLQQIEKAIGRARTVLDGRIHDFEIAGLPPWGKGPRRGVLH